MSAGRKRTTDKHYSAEEQALDQISKEAEERSHERRKARTEAREIRLKEIERQQKEEEERQKDQQQGTGVDPSKSASSYSGSRRGSDDSTDTDISTKDSKDPKHQAREMKHKLKELEEKYKAAMVTNAQLDNIKTSHVFQIELLKEQLEEQEETMLEVQREYKDKCREFELLKRDFENVKLENESIKQHMEIKDKLLKESGLVILVSEEGEFSLTKCGELSEFPFSEVGTSLLSEDVADALKKAGDGSLGKIDYTGNVVPLGDIEVRTPNIYNSIENSIVSTPETENKTDVIDIENRVAANNSITNTEACISCITDLKLGSGNDNKVEVTNLEVCGNDLEVTSYQLDSVIKVNDVKGIGKGDFCNEENAVHEDERELLEVKKVCGTNEEKFLKGEIDSLKVEGEKVCKDSSELKVCLDVESVSDEDAKINMEERMLMDACIEKEIESSNDEDVTLENVSSNSNIGENVKNQDECNVRISFENENDTSALKIDTNACVDEAHDEVIFRVDSRSIKDRLPLTASCISMESDITYHSESSEIDTEYHSDLLSVDLDLKDISNTNVEPEGSLSKQVSSEHASMAGEENEEIRAHQSDSVLSSGGLKQNDEVFLSLCDNLSAASFSTGAVESFARSYVQDVIQKSIDKVFAEGIGESYMVKTKSLSSSDDIKIIIPKRHYSQELVKKAVPFFSRSLSAGSVEILGPVSLAEDGCKYFSYMIDTSVQEENNPVEDNNLESFSTISGYGVCYLSNSESDVDSNALLSPSEDQISLDFGLGFLSQGDTILPEIIPMPVTFLNKSTINAEENIVDRDSHDVVIEEMYKENRGVELDSVEQERMYSVESSAVKKDLIVNNEAIAQTCVFIDDHTSQIQDLPAKPEGVVDVLSSNIFGDIELSVSEAGHVNECSLNNSDAMSEFCAKDEIVGGEGSKKEDSGELVGNDEVSAVELTAIDETDKSIISLGNVVDSSASSLSENKTVEASIKTFLVEDATDTIKNYIIDNATPEIQDGENVTASSKSLSTTVQGNQQQEAISSDVQCDSSVLLLESVATEHDKPKSIPEMVEQEVTGVEVEATNTNGDTDVICSGKKIGKEESKQEQVRCHGESNTEVVASSHLESAAVNSASFEGGSLGRKKSRKKSSKDKKESKEKDDCLLS